MANKQFPGSEKLFRLYAKHKNEIAEIQGLYKQTLLSMNQWIYNTFKERIKAKKIELIPLEIREGYWQFVKYYTWREVDFHFEVLWDDSIPLFYANALRLEVHLENNPTITKRWNTEKMKMTFEVNDVKERGINVLNRKTITVNLDEEMSNEKLKARLIEVFT